MPRMTIFFGVPCWMDSSCLRMVLTEKSLSSSVAVPPLPPPNVPFSMPISSSCIDGCIGCPASMASSSPVLRCTTACRPGLRAPHTAARLRAPAGAAHQGAAPTNSVVSKTFLSDGAMLMEAPRDGESSHRLHADEIVWW